MSQTPSIFDRSAALVARHYLPVIALWVLLAVVLHAIAPRWEDVAHDGDLAYLPADMPSVRGAELLNRAFPDERTRSQLAVVVERPDGPLTSDDLRFSDALAELFRAHADELDVADIWNRNVPVAGDKLISRPTPRGQAALTVLKVRHEYMAVANMRLVDRVGQLLDEAQQTAPPGLNVGITGSAAIAGDMLEAAAESIRNTEWTTIALVVLILLVVYRAPLLVLVPLVSIGVSFFVSIDVLALLTQLGKLDGFSWWHFKVFTTTKIFIIVILFGSGTDFCLFLISRYREELERGSNQAQAVAEALARVSAALVGSALTTIVGLATMYFAAFGKFRSSGPGIAVCLAIALAACLTLAPALLAAAGKTVFWPFGIRQRPRGDDEDDEQAAATRANRFWHHAAGAIVARPGLILAATLVLLAPLAYRGLSVDLTYDLLGELEPSRPSVRGTAIARRHFAAGEMSPILLLIHQQDARFDQPEGESQIARLTETLYDLPDVDSVRSLSEPTGENPTTFPAPSGAGLRKLVAQKHKLTRARFLTQVPELAGQVTRLEVVLRAEPFSPEAIDQLDRLEAALDALSADPASPWHEATFAFVGTTVGVRDLAAVTAHDERLIQVLVVTAVLAVLLVLLRRPLLCVYLILSVLFSYLVTIGATQLFFAWLYGETYFGLDWKVPIFLFVILVAIGEDYNIYLVTRVIEEQRRHGPIDGLRRAVAKTGGIITSCGIIMAGTFISMTTGTMRGITELGFALSLGILLDTCVVRPVLVPAFLALLERLSARRQTTPGESERPPHERPRATAGR